MAQYRVLVWLAGLSMILCSSSCGLFESLPPATYTNDLGMTYQWVPFALLGSPFWMGSPESERGRFGNERRHKVDLTGMIYVQSTEVTQGQWRAVMGSNPSYYSDCGDDCPVECISWYEAVEFCNRLSEREGLTPAYAIAGEEVTWDRSADGYRLPTEAEWEFVARGSFNPYHALPTGELTVDPYSCDLDPNLDEIAWYCGNAGGITHPVGQKDHNALGLYDTHGNVWEWCWDWNDQYQFEDASTPVVDPTGPADPPGTRPSKVKRGGSAYEQAHACRSAKRQLQSPASDTGLTGLRTVRFVFP